MSKHAEELRRLDPENITEKLAQLTEESMIAADVLASPFMSDEEVIAELDQLLEQQTVYPSVPTTNPETHGEARSTPGVRQRVLQASRSS
jgi:hypothetical protein